MSLAEIWNNLSIDTLLSLPTTELLALGIFALVVVGAGVLIASVLIGN